MDARTTPASAVHPGTNARSAPAPDALSAARRIGAGSARARPVGADARRAPVSGARRANGRAISGSARARLTGADARPAPVAGARRADGRAIPGSARAPVAAANRRSAAAPAAPPAGNQRLRFGRVGSAGAANTNSRQQTGAARSGAPQPVAAPERAGRHSSAALHLGLHDAARRVLRYYPFTLLGTAVAGAAVYLLGSAFASGSPHEFLLSITGFLTLLVLAGLGRLQAYRCKLVEFEWDSSAPLAARELGTQHRLRTRAARSWLFYRIHLRISWRLQAGRRASLRGYREVATPGGEASIPLWFPCSGRLQMTGRFTIRDVFGLTRAQIRPPERRTLVVRPGLLAEQSTPPVEISAGFDTTQRARTSDEEQYFMREYMPGDRMKDINWKATSRLGELITRISPITQEQTQELHVVLRRYHRRGGETLTAVLHLDFIKSWLLTFLRVVKQHHPEYVFVVDSGGESHRVDSPEEIEALARRLAELPLTSELPAADTTPARELFIFSTVFDEDLPRFVERSGAQYINLFRSVPAAASRAAAAARRAGEQVPDPYRMSVCETPLPTCAGGGWLLTRDRRTSVSEPVFGRQPGLREEQQLKVSYLCTSSS